MNVKVDVEKLEGLPKFFDRMGRDAKAIKLWLEPTKIKTKADLSGHEAGYINDISGGVGESYDTVTGFLHDLETKTAAGFAEAVRGAITHYKNTDDDHARELADKKVALPDCSIDELHRGLDQMLANPAAASHAPDKAFGNAHVVQGQFMCVPPPSYEDEYEFTPRWYHITSPSAAVQSIVWKLCHKDIYRDLIEGLVGHWAKIRAMADYYDGASKALRSMSDNMGWAAEDARECWHAVASDACQVRMDELGRKLRDASDALKDLAKQYEKAADHMNAARGAINGLYTEMLDLSLTCVASTATSAALSWTGVGAVVSGSIAALSAAELIKTVGEITTMLGRIDTFLINQNGVIIAQLDGSLETVKLPKLPSAPELPGA